LLAKKVANALEELLGGAIVRDLALVRGISEDGEAVDGVEVVLVPSSMREYSKVHDNHSVRSRHF